ncbi:MAG TPA: LacI family DNA-binding transcriptional regulator [Acetobacteraceae bacterium]|nr:LacI family DNA-binding transcriptional regulator [Acetobacteraceae bacterium]
MTDARVASGGRSDSRRRSNGGAVTLHSVAAEASVSSATVSRVLTNTGVVAPETRARVLSAVASLGYQPNLLAQSLRLGRGQSVALLVGDIEQSFYSVMTSRVQAALEEIGLDLLLFNLSHSEDRLWHVLRRAKPLRLRGILLAASHILPRAKLEPLIAELDAAGIPVIGLGQRLGAIGGTSIVDDEARGAVLGARHLHERGRAPIAYVGRISDSVLGRARYRGYRQALAGLGLPHDPRLVWNTVEKYRFEAGYTEMGRALERGLPMRSVLAASAELAAGAMAAALDRGRKVPDEIAFVGFGGSEWAAHVRPALTTVTGDIEALGAHVRDIFRNLETEKLAPRLTVIMPRLEIRGSS